MTSEKIVTVLIVTLTSRVLAADAPREVIVPSGTVLRVQLENSVASDSSRIEDVVRGRLVAPLVVDGRTVVPSDSPVVGHVTQAVRSGKVKGLARIGVRFDSLTADGERYAIQTRQWTKIAPSTKGQDAAKIGLPAAGGAVVGGIVGGKKGAAIGAGAGGGAGTAVVMTTRGKEVRMGRGAVLYIRLDRPLSVRLS
jgi:hypothetical protein